MVLAVRLGLVRDSVDARDSVVCKSFRSTVGTGFGELVVTSFGELVVASSDLLDCPPPSLLEAHRVVNLDLSIASSWFEIADYRDIIRRPCFRVIFDLVFTSLMPERYYRVVILIF